MSTALLDEYRSRLGEKVRLLDMYKNETDEVKRVLDAKETEVLNRRLKARQRLVDRINRVDKEIDGLMKGAEAPMKVGPKETRGLIRDYTNKIRNTLESIFVTEQECRVLASTQRDVMKRSILEMRQGRAATKGYDARYHTHPRFLDVRR